MKYQIESPTPKITLEVDIDELRAILHGLNEVTGSEVEKLCDVDTLCDQVREAVEEVIPPMKRKKKRKPKPSRRIPHSHTS